MKRCMEETLLNWKADKKPKPLLIRGARQVGKTYSVRKFASEHYQNFIEVNFEVDEDYKSLFEKSMKPEDFLEYLQIANLGINLSDRNTLVFLDKIQACPRAITALKFLYEQCPFDIIGSGSMLGIAIEASTSFPVGYVETVDMYPMNFKEFVWVKDDTLVLFDKLKQAYDAQTRVMEPLHKLYGDLFKDYMVCGGMPAAVGAYIDKKPLVDILSLQRNIVRDYLNDMVKYAKASDKIKVRECFESVLVQLAKENKKFQYKVVKAG